MKRLTEQRRHDEAIALGEREWEGGADDLAFLRQVRASAAKAGAMSLQRRAAHRVATLLPDDERTMLANAELEGRWRETDPDWSPTIEATVDASLPDRLEPIPGTVLHVLKISMPHRQSGYSVRTLYSLQGQAQAGLEPVAVTALDFPASIGVADAAQEESFGGVRHRRLLRSQIPSREPWDRYLDDWATRLAPVVAQERPEVIHVHSGHRGYESALVAMTVARRFDIPVVYEVRGFFESLWTSDLDQAERAEIYTRRRDTEARMMGTADAVVTLSESMREDIVARGVAPERVFVVPNGVDIESFVPQDRSPELVQQCGLTDRFVFGYVSNLDHYREGQELLIDAAVELRRRGVPATALIVGDGSRREFLERRAAELDAGDTVVFTGRVPHQDIGAYYALYDVFVVPRVDERAARLVTPLKPFEAMALGLPVVVSDLPALQEITGHGSRGETFRRSDAGDLADVIQRLAADPARRQELSAAGRAWVEAERQWSGNAQRYRQVYSAVLDAAGPSNRR